MKIKNISSVKNKDLFFYLLMLTGFFLLLELSFFVQSNKAYLPDFTEIAGKVHIPLSVLPGILYFIAAELALHLIYCVLIWVLTLLVAQLFHTSQQLILGMSIWMMGVLTVMVANQYFFPTSKFSDLSSLLLVTPDIVHGVFVFLMACCLLVVSLALVQLLRTMLLLLRLKTVLFNLCLLILSSLLLTIVLRWYHAAPLIYQDGASSERPNIIIIGVDSLRPDFLSYFGHDDITPHFDAFLNTASVFSDAVTPLARTFPSWISILSGQYPKHMGLRTNLAPQQASDFSHLLPAILKRHGYQTIYATDETRFSNIEQRYGFDRVVTAPMGFNDFVVGSLNDFPFSNLLVNTLLGQWLFPYSYANRPVSFTYDPDTFLNSIRQHLDAVRTQPLFLATHFCLSHYPFLYANSPRGQFSVVERYDQSIHRVDQQVGDFLALLKDYRLLDHAIVVMLSDHGEALELMGDRATTKELYVSRTMKSVVAAPLFYPPSLENEGMNQSAGHGTDVLGLTQYHTLLAFKLYGVGQQRIAAIPDMVALIDIKPTLLQLIKLPIVASDGISLAAVIQGKQKALLRRAPLFLESDLTPEAIRTVHPEMRKVLLEGIQYFEVDPKTTRLTVKDSTNQLIMESKQYAVIYQQWILALYPQNQHERMPILVNLETGRWTNHMQSRFAKHSPAASMMHALQTFYDNEI